jgi:hypothetical protein
VLACYKLARFYSCHPNEFLSEPFSALARHLAMTDKLLEAVTPHDADGE